MIEPVDSPPRRGRAHFEEAFDRLDQLGLTIRIEPQEIIVNGWEAAMYMHAFVTRPDGSTICRKTFDLFTFDADGRIARMRAYMGPAQPA